MNDDDYRQLYRRQWGVLSPGESVAFVLIVAVAIIALAWVNT